MLTTTSASSCCFFGGSVIGGGGMSGGHISSSVLSFNSSSDYGGEHGTALSASDLINSTLDGFIT